VHPYGFRPVRESGDVFVFRQNHSRETVFSADYDSLYEILRHEKEKGKMDYARKEDFRWISVIRLPDFVTETDFAWAKEQVATKKKLDTAKAELLCLEEGLCVQMMHIGPFDDEPASVALMDACLAENGYENDFSATRMHHEIYLSDARKVASENLKTVIRHPVKKL